MACTVQHAGERRDKADGFTLVELLVVVVVVAVLAGLIMVAASRSRRQAQQSACVSNLKQISLAYNAYEVDYPDGFFTLSMGSTPMGGGPVPVDYDEDRYNYTGHWTDLWMGQLEAYLRDVHVYVCPSADVRYVNTFRPSQLHSPFTVAYAWNGLVYRYSEGIPRRQRMRERARIIKGHESDHVLFIDSSFYKFYYRSSNLMVAGFANASPVWIKRKGYCPTNKDRRHPPGSNVLFCDGHVESMCFEELWAHFRYEGPDQPRNGYVLK